MFNPYDNADVAVLADVIDQLTTAEMLAALKKLPMFKEQA